MPRTNTNSQPGMRRAAIYARVSDKSQAEDDTTSIGEQLSDMALRIRRPSWKSPASEQSARMACPAGRTFAAF